MSKFEGLGDNVPDSPVEEPGSYAAVTKVDFNVIAGQVRGKDAEAFLAAADAGQKAAIVRGAIGDELYASIEEEIRAAGFPEGIRMDELEKVVRRVYDLYDREERMTPVDRDLRAQGYTERDFTADPAPGSWQERTKDEPSRPGGLGL